ncbi:MAG: choice-of-anchor J domain-containing protein [Bacteroidales bacterium]|nr:choice-of-anchor J domain-containing protein [Bacteroidales bacterium]
MASLKKVFLLFTMLIMTLAIMAQNNVITFQAVVRDANNRLVTNEAISVTIQVLDNSDAVQYTETDNVNSNANGLISTLVGDNNPISFAAINWNDAKFKTTVQVKSSGYEVVSTTPVTADPLAIYASDVNPSGSTIKEVYGKIHTDSLTLAQRITADSIALHKDTKDTAVSIRTAMADTTSAIRNSIGDGTLTITYGTESPVTFSANQKTDASITIPSQTSANNGKITITRSGESISNGTFTLNQSDDQTIDIVVPAKLSDLPNNGGMYAKRDSLNTFMTTNDFNNGRITVPSQFDINNPPTSATCTQDAITICDLVAVFNSVTKRIDSISQALEEARQELEALRPLMVTTDSIPVSTIASTTAKAYGTVTFDGGKPDTKRGMLYSTSDQNLKLGASGVDSVMANGTGKGNYSCDLKQLVPCTQYFVRAFAFNDADTAYGEVKDFTTLPFTCGSTLTDIDGNEYGTLQLGSQCWMQQNLRTTHFADGTEIPLGGLNNHSGARRYVSDSWSNEELKAYGYLYNWDAAMHGSATSSTNPSGVQGVCPDGWHLPSDAEWTQLTSFVASNSANLCDNNPTYIAKALASTQVWDTWGTCSTSSCLMCTDPFTNNSTGFSVLPAGTWHVNGAIGHIDQGYSDGYSIFRTATEHEGYNVEAREFYIENTYVDATAVDKTNGLSIRCVLTCPTDLAYLPTVSVVTLSRTGTTVSMTGNVLSDGGAAVTERGVCWGTTQHPTTSSTHKVATGTGLGNFTVSEDLTPGTTYYIRAYAINSEGTAYGGEITFVMPVPYVLPTVNTGSKFLVLMEGFEGSTLPSSWTTIDNDGDGDNWFQDSWMAHTGEGHVISASHNSEYEPLSTLDNYLITPDITIPSSVLPILTFWYSSLYNNPAYFLVKVGNAGASNVSDFSTLVPEVTSSSTYTKSDNIDLSSYAGQTIRLAFVHTPPTDVTYLLIDDIVVGEAGTGANIVSDVTATTASCGGYVADDGGATVTARGVCWSTSQNPTVSDSHTTDGTGTGSFTSNITGLNGLTTYYVRAYATNSVGTTYGNQVSFTTTEALPVVTTSAVSNITLDNSTINATCGGNVTEAGAYAVTARGVCWSTSQNPTVSDSHTTNGSGLGSFESSLTGLTSGSTYYVRAYAISNAGTVYGNQVSFTIPVVDDKSCPSASTVTDHEGNVYATVQIGNQCWMRENLRTTTSPKTGTYLVKLARNDPGNVYSSLGSKVAHWYSYDSTTYAPKGYGLLYNWCAAMDTANSENYMEVPTPSNVNGNNTAFTFSVSGNHRGICPAGWHIPNYSEWNTLKNSVSYAGELAGGNDWNSSTYNYAPGNNNYAGHNVRGFAALPAGFFNSYNFQDVNQRAYFWCSMQHGSEPTSRFLYLDYNNNSVIFNSFKERQHGLSVRCIKD